MSPEEFCRWLQGFAELAVTDSITQKQWLIIKDHLRLVYHKVTPERYVPHVTIPSPKEFKPWDIPKYNPPICSTGQPVIC